MATILELPRQSTAGAYKIEDDVPLPDRGGPGRPYLYPFREMKVGDSFLVPCGDSELEREKTHRRLTASSRKVPGKFTARRIPGEGVRMWRVA